MTRNIIYNLLLAGGLLFSACTTNNLNVKPNNRYTDENFWTSEKEASAALAGCYSVLHREGMFDGGQATAVLEDAASPNAYDFTNRMGFGVIGAGTQTATNAPIFNSRWVDCYRGIGRCNTLLAKIGNIKMDGGVKERMRGEALFLRAFYYSLLSTYYGGAPLILDPPDVAEQKNLPRTPREEIIAQELADLDSASKILPVKYVGDDIGRATKGAALALKARILLFEASPLINTNNDPGKWKLAADAAKAVIDLAPEAGYKLFPDYRQLFMPENNNSTESIFAVQFKAPEQGSSFDVESSQWNDNAPLRDLIDAYGMQAGFTYDPEHPYDHRDPRMYATIVYPGDTYQGRVTTDTYPFKITGYGVKKYTVYGKEVPEEIITSGRSEINFMILRYADVLLMYAEAQNEYLSQPDQSIYEALNAIRFRARMPDIEEGLTKEEMRQVIRHERRIELAFEGRYYNDVRRWKIAENVMNGNIYNSDNEVIMKRVFDPSTDYWWPISQTQLDLNPNL